MPFTVAQIAQQLRGEVIGDASVQLTGFAPAELARNGELTYAESADYFAAAEQSQAAAILVAGTFGPSKKTLIRVGNARVAMARVLPFFFPPDEHPPGVDPSAKVDASTQVDSSAHIGPNCVVGSGGRIGARSVLMGGNHIGRGCQIGDDVVLFPNVVIYHRTQIGHRVTIHSGTTIGSDGFGYVFDEGRHRKVLQLGNVVIHDDVEIGANVAIDRAALGSTIIGEGTKIDNLVHLAHNVVLGRHCIVTGQVGFGGSTSVGDYCVFAAQSGVSDHLKIGNQAIIGAKSGVMRDVPEGGKVLGIPAFPDRQAKRQLIATQQLPELVRRVRELEKKIEQLSHK